MDPLVCESCGVIDSPETPVSEGFDPFAYEIMEIEEKVILCTDCYFERAQDI